MAVDNEKLKDLIKLLSKYKFILLILAAGIVLMLIPTGGNGTKNLDTSAQDNFSLQSVQDNMENILSDMEGVGRVSVMLTVASGTETTYVTDRSLGYSGSQDNPEDYTLDDETVIINNGSGYQSALASGTIYPEYLGAVIVCDGGENSEVRLKVAEAVSALTGLGADRIKVCKRTD